MTLDREQILRSDDRKLREVKVPEWGGSVYVRDMGADARDIFEGQLKDNDGTRALVAAFTICGEDGVLLFTTDDIAELGKKSSTALTRVLMASSELNGLRLEDVEALEADFGVGQDLSDSSH